MKAIIILVIAAAFGTVLLMVKTNKTTAAAAPVIKLGRIAQGDRVPFSVEIHNRSARARKIKTAKASCACTNVTFARDAIAPGDVTKLRAILNSTGEKGTVRRAVLVTWEDGQQERFPFEADIVEEVPEKWDVGQLLLSERRSTKLLVSSADGKKVHVRSVSVRHEHPKRAAGQWTLSATPRDRGDDVELEVALALSKDFPPGTARWRVDLSLEGTRRDEYSILVEASVPPLVHASPEQISLGMVPRSDLSKARWAALLGTAYGTAITVESVKLNGEAALAANHRQIPEGHEVEVVWTGEPPKEERSVSAEILVGCRLSDGRACVVRIPVNGFIR